MIYNVVTSLFNFYLFLSTLYSVSWVEVGGTVYKPGAFVVLADNILPKFHFIIDIIVFNVQQFMFLCKPYTTNCIIPHFNSYEIYETESCPVLFCSYNNLLDYHPLSSFLLPSYPNSKFIPIKYNYVETC